MEATITTLQGVFKDKIANSLDFPTIWVDLDGAEHLDYEYCCIKSFSPLQQDGKLFDTSTDIIGSD